MVGKFVVIIKFLNWKYECNEQEDCEPVSKSELTLQLRVGNNSLKFVYSLLALRMIDFYSKNDDY